MKGEEPEQLGPSVRQQAQIVLIASQPPRTNPLPNHTHLHPPTMDLKVASLDTDSSNSATHTCIGTQISLIQPASDGPLSVAAYGTFPCISPSALDGSPCACFCRAMTTFPRKWHLGHACFFHIAVPRQRSDMTRWEMKTPTDTQSFLNMESMIPKADGKGEILLITPLVLSVFKELT